VSILHKNRLPKNILNYFSSVFSSTFLGAAFFSTFSSVFLSSLVSSFLAGAFLAGALVRAFKERPILFFLGSKLIILALTSSPTLTCSLISLTTQ
jgi:hypothetical protein